MEAVNKDMIVVNLTEEVAHDRLSGRNYMNPNVWIKALMFLLLFLYF